MYIDYYTHSIANMLRLIHNNYYLSDPDNTSNKDPNHHSKRYLDKILLSTALQDTVLKRVQCIIML